MVKVLSCGGRVFINDSHLKVKVKEKPMSPIAYTNLLVKAGVKDPDLSQLVKAYRTALKS